MLWIGMSVQAIVIGVLPSVPAWFNLSSCSYLVCSSREKKGQDLGCLHPLTAAFWQPHATYVTHGVGWMPPDGQSCWRCQAARVYHGVLGVVCFSKGAADLVHCPLQHAVLYTVCWGRRPAPASCLSVSQELPCSPAEVSRRKPVTSEGVGPCAASLCLDICILFFLLCSQSRSCCITFNTEQN